MVTKFDLGELLARAVAMEPGIVCGQRPLGLEALHADEALVLPALDLRMPAGNMSPQGMHRLQAALAEAAHQWH